LWSPVSPDAELRIAEPRGRLMLPERFPCRLILARLHLFMRLGYWHLIRLCSGTRQPSTGSNHHTYSFHAAKIQIFNEKFQIKIIILKKSSYLNGVGYGVRVGSLGANEQKIVDIVFDSVKKNATGK